MINTMSCTKFKWYAVRTKTKCEYKVISALESKKYYFGYENKIQSIVTLPGCDGYIYIKMLMDSDLWYFVRNTSNVFGFLEAQKGFPLPIDSAQAEKLESLVSETGSIAKKSFTSAKSPTEEQLPIVFIKDFEVKPAS